MPQLAHEYQETFARGMFDSLVPSRYPPDAAKLVQNGRIERDGTISRRDGSRRKHAAALNVGTGFGGQLFRTAAGVDQEIAIFGSKAYMSDDRWVSYTEIATGLREDYYDFASMRVGATNYLLMANGDSTIKRWDGTTWDTLPNAPSGVKYVEVFNDRLAVAGHSGVLVQMSKVADPTAWTSAEGALTVSIITHDGDPPTGMFQIGPHLLVFEEHATSYIDGFGEQTLIVAQGATGFSRSVGCIAFRSICAVGDEEVCWLSRRGIEYYSTGSRIQLLTHPIQSFMDSVSPSAIQNNPGLPSAVYDEIRQNYLCTLPLDETRNHRIVVVNLYQRGQDWRGAPSVDLQDYAGDDLYFSTDANGYIDDGVAGDEVMRGDTQGYVALVSAPADGDGVQEDTNGYLDTDPDESFPASLYIGPCAVGARVVHSLGYDGFVRKHFGSDYDADDELSNASGGSDVTLTLIPRPFRYGTSRYRKRARAAHISAINDADVTITVTIRANGSAGTSKTVTIPSTSYNQPKRRRTMVSGRGDTPEMVLTTTDRTRIALVGLSAEILREPV